MGDSPFTAIGKIETELGARIHVLEQRDAELRSTIKNLRDGMAAREKECQYMNENLASIVDAYNKACVSWKNNFKVFVQVIFNFMAGLGFDVPAELEKTMYERMNLPDTVKVIKKVEDFDHAHR
jgi:uncharacterized coiled-coil protein SlyX